MGDSQKQWTIRQSVLWALRSMLTGSGALCAAKRLDSRSEWKTELFKIVTAATATTTGA